MVKQIEDSYEVKSEKMILYLKKVHELLKKFVRVQVRQVPRTENSRADALAKLETASHGQTGADRAPHGTFNRRQQRRGPPSNDRTELDGPHMGLSIELDIAKRSEGGM